MARIEDITYELPEELIAVKPADKRDESRLLVISRKDNTISDAGFPSIVDYFQPGDCLVMNNTKVFKARLYGLTPKGKRIEILLTDRLDDRRWMALVKNSKKLSSGSEIEFSGLHARVMEKIEDSRVLEFDEPMTFDKINAIGETPLPPYIVKRRRVLGLEEYNREDSGRYQSVMAQHNGSVAAPTASLHFTEELLELARRKGVTITTVTLHVGQGTFKPIDTERIEDFQIHSENIEVPDETVKVLRETKVNGGRVIAVGTTVTRALETMAQISANPSEWKAYSGSTRLFIRDEYPFHAVDALITNFHMPKSSLLLLVFSFGGKELIQKAYRHAIQEKYRFLSYGDAMLIF